jgi:hypothetical protein
VQDPNLVNAKGAKIRHIDFEDGKDCIEIHYDKKYILEVLVPNLSS